METSVIFSEAAPRPIGPYSQAIRAGNMIFTAGQVALTEDGTLVDGGAAEQTHKVIANLQAVLQAAGATLGDVVKTTIFLKSMDHFAAVNQVYGEYFGDRAPARSTVEVARLPKDALVEIEAIAVVE
jgi:2-iminobutanoate/2-iminopropanoate deaminase